MQSEVLRWTEGLLAVSVMVSSAEFLSLWRNPTWTTLTAWTIVSTSNPVLARGWTGRALGRTFPVPGDWLLSVLRLSGAAGLLIVGEGALHTLCLTAVFLTSWLWCVRCQYGLEGSDQANLIVSGALVVGYLAGARGLNLALVFIALQLVLAFETAGIAKLVSPSWRSGRALAGILTTDIYGRPALGVWLSQRLPLARLACWAVIAFEVSFVFALLLDDRAFAVLLAAGGLFHLSIAVVMGLNGFFWSFLAMYPSLFWLRQVLY